METKGLLISNLPLSEFVLPVKFAVSRWFAHNEITSK
jgi:hypothetical protein